MGDSQDQLSADVKDLNVNELSRISEEKKTGFFYRLSKSKDMEDTSTNVIGVYARSVMWCDEELTASDVNFNDIRSHIKLIGTTNNNCLGVCFFGVWSYQEEKEKGKTVTVRKRVVVPVKNSQGGICIWKTQLVGSATTTIPLITKYDQFHHMQYNRARHDPHTEKRAIDYLELPTTKENLWKEFQKQTDLQNIPQQRVLDCKGFHFLSHLDACDECLQLLISFQDPGNDMYNQLDGKPRVPFIITFTSEKYYNYHLYGQAIRFNGSCSASLMYYPSYQLLYTYIKEKSPDPSKFPVHSPSEDIKHQETIELKEGEEFKYIVLNVNNGAPVKVNYNPVFKF